jgi:hypothetical protein
LKSRAMSVSLVLRLTPADLAAASKLLTLIASSKRF